MTLLDMKNFQVATEHSAGMLWCNSPPRPLCLLISYFSVFIWNLQMMGFVYGSITIRKLREEAYKMDRLLVLQFLLKTFPLTRNPMACLFLWSTELSTLGPYLPPLLYSHPQHHPLLPFRCLQPVLFALELPHTSRHLSNFTRKLSQYSGKMVTLHLLAVCLFVCFLANFCL